MQLTNHSRLLKAIEVGDKLGIIKARTYQLTREGEFDEFLVKVGDRQYRYRPDGLADYIARGGRPGNSRQSTVKDISNDNTN